MSVTASMALSTRPWLLMHVLALPSPGAWEEAVLANILPTPDGWTRLGADSYVHAEPGYPQGVVKPLKVTGACWVCLKDASLWCSKCQAIVFCWPECQKKLKESHKQTGVSPIPNDTRSRWIYKSFMLFLTVCWRVTNSY